VKSVTWGTLCNLVLELTAVVWDDGQNQYGLKIFRRDDAD
jgi:FAD/FMN-containing dehydrogenase